MLIRSLWSSFFLLTGIWAQCATFEIDGFIIHNAANYQTAALVAEKFAAARRFYENRFDSPCSDSLEITIMPSVNEMMRVFAIEPFIAGYYYGNKVYIQPVDILLKKGVVEKTVFIEYSHYFIDTMTHMSVPGWFNEGMSSYYYYQTQTKKQPAGKLLSYAEICNFQQVIKNRSTLDDFYYSTNMFLGRLDTAENGTLRKLIEVIRAGNTFEAAFKIVTGKSCEELYRDYLFLDRH